MSFHTFVFHMFKLTKTVIPLVCISLILCLVRCKKNTSPSMAQEAEYLGEGSRKIVFYDPSDRVEIFSLIVGDKNKIQITNDPKMDPRTNNNIDYKNIGIFVNRTIWDGFWKNGVFIEIGEGKTYDLRKRSINEKH